MIDRRIGSAEAGLKDLQDPKAKAAEAAADAEAALARVRELSGRYFRARTACFVLAREIESYRQKNQGPILTRASELFGGSPWDLSPASARTSMTTTSRFCAACAQAAPTSGSRR